MDRLNFNTKLYEVCSDDDLRPTLCCIHFHNEYAYATDGCIVIKQSLEYHFVIHPELLNGKRLHRDNYKAIMQFDTAECFDNGIACKSSDGCSAFFDFFNDESPFLNFESVLSARPDQPVSFIGVNPIKLAKLAKAFHSPSGALRLTFSGKESSILVDVPGIDNQLGAIMPVVLNDTLF